jgi:hypothetical protein
MSATTTQLLSSDEFYKLRYDTIPVKSALKVHQQTCLSIPITQKFHILNCDILVANERYLVNTLEYVYICVRGEPLDSALDFGVNDSRNTMTKTPNANIWSHSNNYTKH